MKGHGFQMVLSQNQRFAIPLAGLWRRIVAIRVLKYGLCAAALSVCPIGPQPALAAGETSAYTKLDFEKNCISTDEYEGGASFVCSGYKGWPIHFAEGDLRQSIFFGHLGPWFMSDDGSSAFVSFGTFNYIGETVEWRLDDKGIPFAAIIRFTLQTASDEGSAADSKDNSQVLVVSTVGQPGIGVACVAGMIDARLTPNANSVARAYADKSARRFNCAIDEAGWQGIKPDPLPSMSLYYPGAEPPQQQSDPVE
jgi:hypothetical protein